MPIGKAILLSAGRGSRLLPLTAERPKCLVELSGRTILEWQLDTLAAAGISEAVVVTGFGTEIVEGLVAKRPGVRTLFNPFYHVADNLGSVWMARHELDSETLLLNGDTLVSANLLAKVLRAQTGPIAVTVDEKHTYDADDMKVLRDGDRLLRIGKTIEAFDAESIGLIAFRDEGAALFRDEAERLMRTREGTGSWYLRAIDGLAQRGEDVRAVSIAGEEWQEVDYPADVEKALDLTDRWASRS